MIINVGETILTKTQISLELLWFSLNKKIAYSHWVLIRGHTLLEIAFLDCWDLSLPGHKLEEWCWPIWLRPTQPSRSKAGLSIGREGHSLYLVSAWEPEHWNQGYRQWWKLPLSRCQVLGTVILGKLQWNQQHGVYWPAGKRKDAAVLMLFYHTLRLLYPLPHRPCQ